MDFLKQQKLHSSQRIQDHHFQKYFTHIVNSQSSRCSMKLHIVVMPQRGLFQGFGTQCRDWKKKLCYGPWFPPQTLLRGGGVGGVGGRAGGRSEVHPHHRPVPGITLANQESRMTTVHFRIGEDSWHLNHRCRSVLDDQSYAAVLDILRGLGGWR